MRKIAFDLGTKTCGVAITDEKLIIASPVETLSYNYPDFKTLLIKIKKVFERYEFNINEIILGYPTNVNDTKNNMTIVVEEFYSVLKSHFSDLNITLFDERYTTRIATDYLFDLGIKNSVRKKNKDHIAAQVILETYLRKINS